MRMVRSPKHGRGFLPTADRGLSLNGQRDASRLLAVIKLLQDAIVCVWKKEEGARVAGRQRQVQIPLDNECVCYVSGYLRVPAMHAFKQSSKEPH